MPIRLPRLTLFSGPQCSLCDHNFDLTTIDIHSPGQERWKRRYIYWIPALHLDDVEIAKGRWDATTVRPFLEKWRETQGLPGKGDDSGLGSQHVDTPSSDILGDNLFFFDASAMTAWPTQVTQYTTESVSALGTSLQDDALVNDEPPYDPDAVYVQPGAKQCFNCMATTHIVSDCPRKRDPQHIALARVDYGSKGGNTTRYVRLHEAEEDFKRRVEFARTFEPGLVQGRLLRESLGLSEIYGGGNEDLPWYHTMCDWGYPPGWVSEIDPRIKIMERINSTSKYELNEGFPSLTIYDDEHSESLTLPLSPKIDSLDNTARIPPTVEENPPDPIPNFQTPWAGPPPDFAPPPPGGLPPPPPDDLPPPPPADSPPPPPSVPPPVSPPPLDSLPFPPRRWVNYRTTLFQSERLPTSLVSRPLPALTEAPPPPPSGSPPPPPPPLVPPPPLPPQPPEELTEQEKRRQLWEQIVAANS